MINSTIFIENKYELKQIKDQKGNLLIKATTDNDINEVRRLLTLDNINVNMQNQEGWTALMLAINEGRTEIVKLLLAHPDINVELQKMCGITALMCASKHGHIEIVQLLLAHPATNVMLQNVSKHKALMIAIEKGNLEIVKLLLARKEIEVNLQDQNGKTALILAIEKGNLEIVKLLLTNPNINLQDKIERAALICASKHGHIEIVKLLLSHGALISKDIDILADINQSIINIITKIRGSQDVNQDIHDAIKLTLKKWENDPDAHHLLLTAKVIITNNNGVEEEVNLLSELFKHHQYTNQYTNCLDQFNLLDNIRQIRSPYLNNFLSNNHNLFSQDNNTNLKNQIEIYKSTKHSFVQKLNESRQNNQLTDCGFIID